ncbi:hypothetical protein [Myceligenerans xiligouense]|uniref:hypothetical protein n=1 Tax=Myceligenerans xiligouense TaxID=253184 RepID=UPI000F4DBE7D|nr:hypothetical protein [Myceligenerans xiligouense]
MAIAAVPTWLSVEHLRTFAILEEHGVRTSAEVLAFEGARGPRTMMISPDDNPSVFTRLNHWPRGTEVGDTLEITYDPANPGRVMAVDAPAVDASIAIVALFEIGALGLVAVLVPPGLVLLVRRVRDPAWRRRSDPGASTGRDGRQPRRHRLVWVPGAWRRIRHEAQEQGAWTSILVFAVTPITFTLLCVGVTVVEVRDLVALDERGVAAQAEVLGSEWGSNRQDRLMVWVDGEESWITRWTGVPRYGDPIDVIYLPENPRVARQAGVFPWGPAQFVLVAAGIVSVITTPFVTSAAIAGLLARAARAHGRRSAERYPTGQSTELP